MKKKYLLLIGCLGLCLFAGCSNTASSNDTSSESGTSDSQAPSSGDTSSDNGSSGSENSSSEGTTSDGQDTSSGNTSSDSSSSDNQNSGSSQEQNAYDDLKNQGKDLRTLAEECMGKDVSELISAIGDPNSISSEEDPELGTIDYYYYDDFTVSVAADEDGNQKVTGIW